MCGAFQTSELDLDRENSIFHSQQAQLLNLSTNLMPALSGFPCESDQLLAQRTKLRKNGRGATFVRIKILFRSAQFLYPG